MKTVSKELKQCVLGIFNTISLDYLILEVNDLYRCVCNRTKGNYSKSDMMIAIMNLYYDYLIYDCSLIDGKIEIHKN